MIKSFKHNGLKELNEKGKSRKVKADFHKKCLRVMDALNVADKPEDMNIIGFRFHGLQGKPKRYSVRINHNYRVTFGWDNGAIDVDLEDYH